MGKHPPPQLSGSGKGTKVLVLGAGPGGCPTAYELMKLGYDVTVIEARDRLGGHAFTVRGGSKTEEYSKGEQTCDWPEGFWYDAGPSRVPFYHRGFYHYASELNVPLMDHKNIDLKYIPSSHRGYEVFPDTQSAGKIADPYPLEDLLPYASSILRYNAGYLAATSTFDWQNTLTKPKDGVGELYQTGFAKALGDKVELNCEVTEIRQSEDGVKVVYLDKTTGKDATIEGDYVMCNIPLSVLINLKTDFSSDFTDTIRSVPNAMAMRLGLGYKRRFREEDDWIYGGQSFSNIAEFGTIDYPDNDYGTQGGAMLGMYNTGNAAAKVNALSHEEQYQLALEHGSKIHPQMLDEYISGFSVAWHLEKYSLGAWPSYTQHTREEFMPKLQEPDGRVYLVGEHLSNVNACIEGASQAAWMQVEKLHTRAMQDS